MVLPVRAVWARLDCDRSGTDSVRKVQAPTLAGSARDLETRTQAAGAAGVSKGEKDYADAAKRGLTRRYLDATDQRAMEDDALRHAVIEPVKTAWADGFRAGWHARALAADARERAR